MRHCVLAVYGLPTGGVAWLSSRVVRPIAAWVVLAAGCGRIDFVPLQDTDAAARLTYRDAVLADEPMTYWRLSDADATARDEMGHLEGTYSDSCERSVTGALAGDSDAATHFNGTSCGVSMPSGLDLSGKLPFSVELWVALDELGGQQPYLMNELRAAGNPTDGFAMLEGTNPGRTYFERAGSGANRTTQVYASTVGVFAHLVGTYDGSVLRLYANAVQVGTDVQSTQTMQPTSSATLVLGTYPPPTTTVWLHGTLDEVAVYDHVLPLERIELHHAIGTLGPQ